MESSYTRKYQSSMTSGFKDIRIRNLDFREIPLLIWLRINKCTLVASEYGVWDEADTECEGRVRRSICNMVQAVLFQVQLRRAPGLNSNWRDFNCATVAKVSDAAYAGDSNIAYCVLYGKAGIRGRERGRGILSKLGEILYLDKSTLTVLRGVEHG